MKKYLFTSLSIIIIFSGCITTTVVLLDETKVYPKSKSVKILTTTPEESYEVIAHLETRGSVGQALPNLLKNMREKAKIIGADAIIPTEEGREKMQQGLIYNPWLGGYQTIGGGHVPILRGYAIVYLERPPNYIEYTEYKEEREFTGGIGVNLAPIFLNGFGGNFWIGSKRIRFVGEFYKIDIPNSFYRDNFQDGKIEKAYRFGVDYFFLEYLNSLYFPLGLEYWETSVGHQFTTARGFYETIYLSFGLGYLYRFNRNIYFDSRFSLNAALSQETEVRVGGYIFVPDKVGYSAFIGVGFNF